MAVTRAPASSATTLRQHLLRLTLGSLIPVVLIAAMGAVFLALREQATFERGVRERTRAVLTAIDAELGSSITTLNALAASVALERDDLALFHAEIVRAMATQPDWLSVNLAPPSGQQVVNSLVPFGASLPRIQDMASFERVLATKEPAIGDVKIGALTRQHDFAIRVPVVQDGNVRYVLSAMIKPDSIYRLLQAQHLPPDWIGAVVDRNRRFVARSAMNEDRVGKAASPDLQAQVNAAPQGWALGSTIEGTRVYTAHDTSTFSGWSLAIGVPTTVVEAAARRTVAIVVIGAAAAIGLALIVAPLLGRRFAEPISALAESARSLARGERTVAPRASGVAEVAELAQALEEAAIAVHARIATQRQLTVVTNNATVGLLMADARHSCTFMNPAAERMTGYTFAEAQGRSLHDLLHHDLGPDAHAADDCPLHHAFANGQPWQGQDAFVNREGRLYDVEYAASPLILSGSSTGTIIEVRDVTTERAIEAERRALLQREQRARAEAEQSNRAKDEFLAMLGHELRNPLSAITNASHLLDFGEGDHSGRARSVIKRQAAHLARLVDDLLDAGRVATGKIVIEREPVDLREVVQRAIGTLRAAQRTTRHRITIELEPVWVLGDETRLEQVVANLLTNALRYTPPEGEIAVLLKAEGHVALLTVIDTGIGITRDMLPRVFDLFVQGDRGIERSQGGLGIGLTLVKRLIELHGGTVSAASDGDGRGSTFTLRLPRIDQPKDIDAPRVARTHSGTQRLILLVEDNADARTMLRDTLAMAGHQVIERADGSTGLAAALTLHPDIGIVDIGLPGISGYDLARQLRAAMPEKPMTLIAVTGYGQPEDRRKALDAGFDVHIVKPVDISHLLRVIASLPTVRDETGRSPGISPS